MTQATLQQHIDALRDELNLLHSIDDKDIEILTQRKEISMLRQCNEQKVAQEQIIRVEANALRAELDKRYSDGAAKYGKLTEEFVAMRRERDELRTQLDAWHSTFGTTQLTHAAAKKESLEKQCRMLEEEVTTWTDSAHEFLKRAELAEKERDRYYTAIQEWEDREAKCCPESKSFEDVIKDLRTLVMSHREAVLRFLIPHAPHLSESWLEYFEEVGMVKWDGFQWKVVPLSESPKEESK